LATVRNAPASATAAPVHAGPHPNGAAHSRCACGFPSGPASGTSVVRHGLPPVDLSRNGDPVMRVSLGTLVADVLSGVRSP